MDRVARLPDVTTEFDATALPYPDGTVDAVLAEHVFEHFSFAEEALVWREMARVLRPGGTLTLEVPDFEWVCATFLDANDEWREFYRVGAIDLDAPAYRDLHAGFAFIRQEIHARRRWRPEIRVLVYQPERHVRRLA